MKNILVTGGAGYIGSHIVEQLVKNNNKVIIIDNLVTGHKKLINKRTKFIKADIKDKSKIINIIKDNNITSIIHLAAYLNVREAEKNKIKYYKNNITGTKNLLEACKNSNVKNIIFSSSCSIYGSVNGSVSESKKANPKGYYGYTKYKGELLIKKLSRKYKLNYGILRYFNVAGASISGKIGQINKGDQLFKNLSIEVQKKKPIFKIYGTNYKTKDGTCVRDYIHVSDISDIHYKVLSKIAKFKTSIVLNCGYGKGISVSDTVKEFKKYASKDLKIVRFPNRKGDMVKIIGDNSKLKKLIKWKPKFNNLSKIVKSCIIWEKKLK